MHIPLSEINERNTFKTKTGFCHILSDKILLTREGVAGTAAKHVTGNNIIRVLIIYGLITAGIFYSAYVAYSEKNYLFTIFCILFGIWILYGIAISLKNSATPIIVRSSIIKIIFKPAITGIKRAHFEVLFTDANGKQKKRLIMLPGSLNNGVSEVEKALAIMKQEKLLGQ